MKKPYKDWVQIHVDGLLAVTSGKSYIAKQDGVLTFKAIE